MSKNTQTSGLVNYIAHSGSIVSVSGSLTVTGSLNVTGGMTGSFQGVATTASYVLNAVSASFATTASYAVSASVATNAVTASYALNAVSASFATTAVTSSFANAFTVAGTLTATTLVVQTITSSVLYSSGSNVFGNSLANTQNLTGSVGITGSLSVNGTGTFSNTLDIALNVGNSQNGLNLVNNAGSGYGNSLNFYQSTTKTAQIFSESSVDNTSEMSFRTMVGSTLATRMFISPSGSLGIGTTNPTGRLMLYQSSAGNVLQNIVSNQGGSTQAGINFSPSMTDTEVAANPAQASIYATDSNYGANIIFATKATGAVGNALTTRLTIASTGAATFTNDVILPYSKSLAFNSIANQYITADATGLYLGTANFARLFINTSGNVGIGTTSPATLLDVNGTGRFSGQLTMLGDAKWAGQLYSFQDGSNSVQGKFTLYNAAGTAGFNMQLNAANNELHIFNLTSGTWTDRIWFTSTGAATFSGAVKFGTGGSMVYGYGNVNGTTKTVTINNTGINGTIQINVGIYNNSNGAGSNAMWICGGYGGSGMLATEITRNNGTNTTISTITSNVNSLTFTVVSTGSSDVSIVLIVGDANNGLPTITIA